MQLLKDTFRYSLTLIFLVIFILNANLYGASDKLYNGFYVGSVVKDSVEVLVTQSLIKVSLSDGSVYNFKAN